MNEYDSAEDRLRDYFSAAESVAGLRSIHGALVDRATSGPCGTSSPSSPENQWYDARARKVRRHSETHHTLHQLEPLHVDVLWAYYGSPGWPGPASNDPKWSRSQPPPEVTLALGAPLARVALLTQALAALVGPPHEPHRRLLALCRASGASLAPVRVEAAKIQKAALDAFRAISGELGQPARERRLRVHRWKAATVRPVLGALP